MYVNPSAEFHPAPSADSRQEWSRWLQYLYFLRFCILGWLLLPVLCGLDAFTGASALSRGIMTLTTGWQAFHATFFVVTLATTTLVCARNIVMNGNFRFSSQPPAQLYRWMTEAESSTTLWTVLAVALIPAFITLSYVAWTTIHEQLFFANADPHRWPYAQGYWGLWVSYAAGLVWAFVFWYLVTLFHLWTHEWVKGNGPRALIFPALWPKVEEAMQGAHKPRLAEWLEYAMNWPLKYSHIGYAPESKGPPWELHFLSTVSLIAFVLLYLFLYPIVAPVLTMMTPWPWAEIILAFAICLVIVLGARRTGNWRSWNWDKAGIFFSALFLLLWLCFLYFLASDLRQHTVKLARSFPVLASVTVILIFMQWAINGASFFFDRYRVPVCTCAVALIFLPKPALSYSPFLVLVSVTVLLIAFGFKRHRVLLTATALVLLILLKLAFIYVPAQYGDAAVQWLQANVVDWDADHYFEVRQVAAVTVLPKPAEAVTQRLLRLQGDDQPLVVVTATGGGIQAAEWTAQIMARLEEAFREDKRLNGYLLHDHLLLASGVSGGSVGLVPYLAEYTISPGPAFAPGKDLQDRLTLGPGCSSLEAVAWGLEYYDLQRLAFSLRLPILQSAQDSPDDPTTIVAPDRTWALSRALNRNLNDAACAASLETAKARLVPDAEHLTLGQAAEKLSTGAMPAFTLNTTVAETGGRFLLANYIVPPAVSKHPLNLEFLPAASFLQVYAQDTFAANGPHGQKLFADLPLATAARLSATFPVVSSATRLPAKYAKAASHFLDGGYFDNDGTGSAIEFLYSVMDARMLQQAEPGAPAPPAAKPLKVLLVEIRDGDDLDPSSQQDDLQNQSGGDPPPAAWWTLNQILGPLEGLWNAGHVSVTRRNRRELCVLETAFQGHLFLHHVVFAIPREPDGKNHQKPAPLSWKLTASQLAYIAGQAQGSDSSAAVKNALDWVASPEASQLSSEVCSVSTEVPAP